MKLAIRYNGNRHLPVMAACIRGDDISVWLKEIDRWDIPVDELECFLLPLSISSKQVSGLFIIFKDPMKATHINLLEPYSCIKTRLYIPCESDLIPQVSRDEMESLLLWDKQVFHPSIGMIGFENKDRVDPDDLFAYEQPDDMDWSFAHPGISPRPLFREINIIQPTTEQLIESVKQEIGQKALENIPQKESDKTSLPEKILDTIRFGLFKGVGALIDFAGRILPEGSHTGDSPGNGGFFFKFQRWVANNLEELQKKRNQEIKRLLSLFDEDTNEALQYAIPLNSPYLNRGKAPSSSRLSWRSTNFNLGKLGGGSAVDAWDVSDHYSSLRTKYLQAAKKEIEHKNYKKAAYVYAHLLGDYHSAANTLEQGKMYREAAILYKDHLKNILAAAECLEKGELYLESIELNKELHRDEKVGDLYKRVQQDENAGIYYEKHIETKLRNNDHLDAARVMEDKLNQQDRAKQALLDGWDHSYQYEPCLKKYFDIVLDRENNIGEKEVKDVFEKHTPRHRKLSLLNVLEYVNRKNKTESLQATTREIAYKVVHDEAAQGNVQALHNLKKFLPGDKLIGSDTSRFANNVRKSHVSPDVPKGFQLDQSIRWIKGAWHYNQFLLIGIKNSCLHMARGNWYGNFEYYSWTNIIKTTTRFTFVNAPYYSNIILLHSSEGIPVTRKNLSKNKYFTQSLVVYCPVWLHKERPQFILKGDKKITRLEVKNDSLTLHSYTIDGALTGSVNCTFENQMPSFGSLNSNPLVVSDGNFLYTYKDKYFIIISEAGVASVTELPTIIRFFSASLLVPEEFWMVISTNAGCILFKPSKGNLSGKLDFFAQNIIPYTISFVQSKKFVIAGKTNASLFEIVDDQPILIQQFETKANIIAILPATRGQFAIVEENGRITMYDTGS